MASSPSKGLREQMAVAVASMHYRDNLSQAHISKRLGLGRMQVSRLVRLARELGFVSGPTIRAPLYLELGSEMLAKLPKLRSVKVAVTHSAMSLHGKVEVVSASAAELWENELGSTSRTTRVGIGGGRAMAALVDLVRLEGAKFDCYALSNIPSGDWEVSADTNLAVLKRRFPDIAIHPLLAMQLSPEMSQAQIAADRERLLSLKCVQDHMRQMESCRVIFTGVGSVLDPNLRQRLSAIGLPASRIPKEVTGDISYNLVYHDRHVFHEDCPLNKRLISVPMATLAKAAVKRRSLVAVVGWGGLKARPILDAYRARVFNSLVIDVELAEELLALLERGYLDGSMPAAEGG